MKVMLISLRMQKPIHPGSSTKRAAHGCHDTNFWFSFAPIFPESLLFPLVGKIDVGDQVEVGTGGESLIVVAYEDFGGTSLANNDLTYCVAFVSSGQMSCQIRKAVEDIAVVFSTELYIP